jgi:hypothetical protein
VLLVFVLFVFVCFFFFFFLFVGGGGAHVVDRPCVRVMLIVCVFLS